MEKSLEIIIPILELMGIFVVAVSALKAFWIYLKSLATHQQGAVKLALAEGLALSLEFKMGAEILKTVQIRQMNELLVLGAVILLRALLSFLIHAEMKRERGTE